MVETTTTYSSFPRDVTRNGFQYIYRKPPCDPANIGSIIGQGGKNISSLIDSIQKERVQKWYGPMPDHIDCENTDSATRSYHYADCSRPYGICSIFYTN